MKGWEGGGGACERTLSKFGLSEKLKKWIFSWIKVERANLT